MKPQFKVLITDLDNTLFDWVEVWFRSFDAMMRVLAQKSGVSREQLESEAREIHQLHHTSEYAFLIEELPSLRERHPNDDVVERYEEAIEAFRTARSESLRLYPKVAETLRELSHTGTLLVGYTESMAFYTNYRLRHLGLDSLLDFVYSPPDHAFPKGMTPEQIRRYSSHHYQLARTVHRHISAGETKPNPKVLLDIISEIGASAADSVYIGDSRIKDVTMAQSAGVTDVWAKYGKAQDRPEYELLRRVTHWHPADVAKEKALQDTDVKPSYTAERDFAQLTDFFSFEKFTALATG